MRSKRLTILEVERHSAHSKTENLSFKPGVNLIVGRPNTGKTKWLTLMDFALGSKKAAEDALSNRIAEKYDVIRMLARLGTETVVLERRWKEPGAKHKIFIDDRPVRAQDFSTFMLGRLSIPENKFPHNNPLSPRPWPLISWRSLLRHIYRRQGSWTSFVAGQFPSESHACLLQFLGIAEKVLSTEYELLAAKERRQVNLQAQRETLTKTLTHLSQELVDHRRLAGKLSEERIDQSVESLRYDLASIRSRRTRLLEQMMAQAANKLESDRIDLPSLSEQRAELLAIHTKITEELQEAESRLGDIESYASDIRAELVRMKQATVAGAGLAKLRITHCPACDQEVSPNQGDGCECFLCRRPTTMNNKTPAGLKRLEAAVHHLRSEAREAETLITELRNRRTDLKSSATRTAERIVDIEADLGRIRPSTATLIPPEISTLDSEAGRIEEKIKQWERIRESLSYGEILGSMAKKAEREGARLAETVESQIESVDFDSASDLVARGMNEYLNHLNKVRSNSWTQAPVSLHLSRGRLKFEVGGESWTNQLGGTLSLYLLAAYQYALLTLTNVDGCHYPGIAILDMPAELAEVDIEDLENFVLAPFLSLANRSDDNGLQIIVAGSSFEGFPAVTRHELTKIWS